MRPSETFELEELSLPKQELTKLSSSAANRSVFCLELLGKQTRNFNLQTSDIDTINSSLQRNSNVKTLCLVDHGNRGINLTLETLNYMLSQLEPLPSLRTLDLSVNDIGKAEISTLYGFLKKNPKVNKLYLSYCDLNAECFRSLTNMLSSVERSFKAIGLRDAKVGAKALCRFIRKVPLADYGYLYFADCDLQDAGMVPVVQSLLNKQIRKLTLEISSNGLSDAACQTLAPLLETGVVTELLAHDNQITDAGLKILYTAANLYNFQKPRDEHITIELGRGNLLSKQGQRMAMQYQGRSLTQLSEAATELCYTDTVVNKEMLLEDASIFKSRKQPLKVIRLERCQMDESKAEQLARLLRVVPTQAIEILDNPLGCNGLMTLLKTMCHADASYPHVTQINFGNCQIGDPGFLFFLQHLKHFPNVTTLYFNQNLMTESCAAKIAAACKRPFWQTQLTLQHDPLLAAASGFQTAYPVPAMVQAARQTSATERTGLLSKK